MQVRSLSALGLMAVLAACGGGDKKSPSNPQKDGGIDNSHMDGGGSGGGDGDTTASCTAGQNDTGYPAPTKTQIWTDAQFEACYTACQDATTDAEYQTCLDTKCDAGANDFFDCLYGALYACTSKVGAGCRDEWEAFICCEDSKCIATDTDDQCFAKCKTEANQFAGTGDTNNPGCIDTVFANGNNPALRDPCLDESRTLCIKPGGAVDAGAAADGGTTGDAGTKTDAGTATDAGTKADGGAKPPTPVVPHAIGARRDLARQLHALTR